MSLPDSDPFASEQSTPPPATRRRRSSLAELFASRPNTAATGTSPQQAALMSATLTQQAQEATRNRRLSITQLGLSGSQNPGQGPMPFGQSLKAPRKSQSVTDSVGRSSFDERDAETAIDESDSVPPMSPSGSDSSKTPPTRRLSFGARAYGQARSASTASGINGSNGAAASSGNPSAKSNSPSSPTGRKEGFSWTENFRSRAERASISAASGPALSSFAPLNGGGHTRSASQTISEPVVAPAPPPLKPAPKQPDAFQERILKGDFYMD